MTREKSLNGRPRLASRRETAQAYERLSNARRCLLSKHSPFASHDREDFLVFGSKHPPRDALLARLFTSSALYTT